MHKECEHLFDDKEQLVKEYQAEIPRLEAIATAFDEKGKSGIYVLSHVLSHLSLDAPERDDKYDQKIVNNIKGLDNLIGKKVEEIAKAHPKATLQTLPGPEQKFMKAAADFEAFKQEWVGSGKLNRLIYGLQQDAQQMTEGEGMAQQSQIEMLRNQAREARQGGRQT